MEGVERADIRSRTLLAIRQVALHNLLPSLTGNAEITSLHVLIRLVDFLLAEEGAQGTAAIPSALAAAWSATSGEDPSRLADDEYMERKLPDLVARPDAREFVRQYATWRTELLCARDPEAAGGVGEMFRGGKSSSAENQEPEDDATQEMLSTERLQAYLRARSPENGDIEVKSLTLLPGGFSKQTIKVETEKDGKQRNFVLRKDFEVSPAERTVREEYPLLSAVASMGTVPVPRPLWLESSFEALGTPTMAVDLMPGSGDVSHLLADPAKGRRAAKNLAGAVARLHAMDAEKVLPDYPKRSTCDHVHAEIDRWYRDWRRWRTEPHPALEATFRWLLDNIPATTHRPAIVHGDIGFHNMLIDDADVTALLDWEFSHIGDPAEDIVYCRQFVAQLVDWEYFLKEYEAAGGTRPSPEADRFYAAWASARNSSGCAGSRYYFLNRRNADVRLGVSGLTFLPRFELDAFARVVDAL